jgi:hypothetical protein
MTAFIPMSGGKPLRHMWMRNKSDCCFTSKDDDRNGSQTVSFEQSGKVPPLSQTLLLEKNHKADRFVSE